jgi:hypothetical protein
VPFWKRLAEPFTRDFRRAFLALHADIAGTSERLAKLAGTQAALALRNVDRVQSLAEVGFKVTSEWDEDGIIEWLVQKVPVCRPLFVEFGVTDYQEANTCFLLRHRNWKGLVMDQDPALVKTILDDQQYWRNDLTAVASFVTAGNINGLLRAENVHGRIGLLSIDIDGNDYWVWKAIDAVDPDIVICEYNAVFGDRFPITMPYLENFQRVTRDATRLYFGTSIGALELLADAKGYCLLGSNRAGGNAFFIRRDLFHCVADRIVDKRARPSLFRDARDEGGARLLSGIGRAAAIGHMPVVRVDTGETVQLDALGPLYSSEWLTGMGIEPG